MISETNIKNKILEFLREVPDPEIPVLNIVDLGIIRDIREHNNFVEVDITPTYSGCPAMKVIEDDIAAKLREKGINNFRIKNIISPAWTTDWISAEGRNKLREYGIAPPEEKSGDKNFLLGKTKNITCPHCKSINTILISQFGSTPCKALYKCKDCTEPFDYFKCH